MNMRWGASKTAALIGIIIILAAAAALIAVWRLDTSGKRGNRLGQEFNYDLTKLRKIDPHLIMYEEIFDKINTGLKDSCGIAAADHDDIYVTGDNAVLIFDKNGTSIGEIKLNQTPRCLAWADGQIYLGMKEHVEIYLPDGTQQASWESLGTEAVLTSIAVGRNDVFVADAGNRIVVRYDKQGKLINLIGGKNSDKNIPGFVVPSPYFDLALAPDGLLRVVNPGRHRIEAYTPDGHLEFWWGNFSTAIEGFCGCCNPVNFALLNNDEGFVTCEKGLTRIKIYDAEGKFVAVVAGSDAFSEHDSICALNGPDCTKGGFDVAVDSQGRILILDPFTGEIRIFTKIKSAVSTENTNG